MSNDGVPKTASFTFDSAHLSAALVEYAQRMTGVPFPCRYSAKMHGSIVSLGDKIVTITVEHLPNVVPIAKPIAKARPRRKK